MTYSCPLEKTVDGACRVEVRAVQEILQLVLSQEFPPLWVGIGWTPIDKGDHRKRMTANYNRALRGRCHLQAHATHHRSAQQQGLYQVPPSPAHSVAHPHHPRGRTERGGRAWGPSACCVGVPHVRGRAARRAVGPAAGGSSGARTLSAAEERARLPLRAAFQNGDAGGMLMKWARAVRL